MSDENSHNKPDLERLLRREGAIDSDRLREVWMRAASIEESDFPDSARLEETWTEIEGRMRDVPVRRDRPALRLVRRPRTAAWAALGVAAVIGLVVIGWLTFFGPVVHLAPPGEVASVVLPDGSKVELNSGSRLRYARRFGTREVELLGEGFFDVAPDGSEFTVRTFDARVVVTGTRFNVRAWEAGYDPGTVVTLLTGRVSVAAETSTDAPVEMLPGQRVRMTAGSLSSAEVDSVLVDAVTSWRRGELVFRDEPLGVILEDVERRYGIDISLRPYALGNTNVTFIERRPVNEETILNDLSVALQLRYRPTSNGFEVYREP